MHSSGIKKSLGRSLLRTERRLMFLPIILKVKLGLNAQKFELKY